MNIGFIGLGIMGQPMAANLIKAGHTLFVHSRSGTPAELTDAGATACASAAEVARSAEVVITMLPDTPDVERVLFGEGGVAEGLRPGSTVVDMSSIAPGPTRNFAQRIAALGGDYLDAPVSGGQVGAVEATLTIMVGGAQAAFERIKPLFEVMGGNITLIGEVGAGQVCKIANQIIVALNIEAVGEALVLASRAGVDPARVRSALMGGFASSRVLEVHGQRMIDRSVKPGFRISLHSKDLNLALSSARELNVALPNTATCQELFNACMAQEGGADWDHSGVIRALEGMANHAVGAQTGTAK